MHSGELKNNRESLLREAELKLSRECQLEPEEQKVISDERHGTQAWQKTMCLTIVEGPQA